MTLNHATVEPAAQFALTDEGRIDYETSFEIREVISRIGRTEDIKLSPDNKTLAVLDYLDNRLYLFSIQIAHNGETPGIKLPGCSIISSASFHHPHGVAFLGQEHIIVCSRHDSVNIFRVPPVQHGVCEYYLRPEKTINGNGLLRAKVKTPGSVDCYKIGKNTFRVLVCNNSWHFVSSHIVNIGKRIKVKRSRKLIENGIKIPDGISIGSQHDFIAISNHVDGDVLIYKNAPGLDEKTPPIARLRGAVCPHGVRISRDGNRVFVADSASQYLFIYEKGHGDWRGIRAPSNAVKLLDDEAFYFGRDDVREGGIKGIDLDNSNSILVTTRRHDVLGFYDLPALLARRDGIDHDEIGVLYRQRDWSNAKHKRRVLVLRWTPATRARDLATAPWKRVRGNWKRARNRQRLWYLAWRNRWSRESILDPMGPVVSLTTYGLRLALAFHTIESIALGRCKPSRLILWLQDEQAYADLPGTLQRLQARGLEIKLGEALGPHTKYYHYLATEVDFRLPLVTADDDVLYPRDWLQQLVTAHAADPSVIHCYWAKRMCFHKGRFMPYKAWDECASAAPSQLNFIVGVSGAIYPPEFLHYVKKQGRAFEESCPAADDIWLTVNALRAGFKIAQVQNSAVNFPLVPGTQKKRLMDQNVLRGGNQLQLRDTFLENEVEQCYKLQLMEGSGWCRPGQQQ